MGVAILAVELETFEYLHNSSPLLARSPTTPSPVNVMRCLMPLTLAIMDDEYPASSLCDFHTTFPFLLFKATTEASDPPGLTKIRSPSMSGDSLIPQFRLRAPKRSSRFIDQIDLPVEVSRQESVPSAARA